MNIVLLSGGSGVRLWPLSNEIRSKQFVKLFRTGDGSYESMVQRVYRQIKEVDKTSKITIATSSSQVSSLKNQLGDNVSICLEPCRRDTFPAIALASVFLNEVVGIGREEVVAVCPIDPYVDNDFFEAIEQMETVVLSGDSNLTLMGIEPTYPSDKYGYIIPTSSEHISVVREFKEKPDTETAKKFISQGALWNAGVFAFKLGYMVEKAHRMIDFSGYADLLKKYGDLEKISFDYAVVEKETSIRVVRFSGNWKDVGTWSMMTEVMSDKVKGNALVDDCSENTNVINDLDIPVLVMGCSNMVVVASDDGILISDKDRSDHMKPYVEKIKTYPRFVEKSWGCLSVLDRTSKSISMKVLLDEGKHMSYHSHAKRDEIWTVISGSGRIVLDGVSKPVKEGDSVQMVRGSKHTIIADTAMTLIEVQVGQEIEDDDKQEFDFRF